MPCCEYQIFMTLSSLTPVLVILLFIQTTLLIFQYVPFCILICHVSHRNMPSFARQKVAYRITILLFMRVALSALFVVNAVLVSVFFIENKKQAKSKDRFSLLFNNNECFTAQVQPDNGRSRISRCGCLQILFFLSGGLTRRSSRYASLHSSHAT